MNIDISQIGYRWKGIYSEYLAYADNDVVYKNGGAYVIRNGVPVEFALGQQDAVLKGHLLTGGVSAGGFGNMVLHSKGTDGVEFRFQDTRNGTLATKLMDNRTNRNGQYLTSAYYMIAMMNDGSARSWGGQANGRGGAGLPDVGRTFPTRVAFPPGTPPVIDACSVWSHTYLITADGMAWSCGDGAYNLSGVNATNVPIPTKMQGYGDLGSTTKIVKIRVSYSDTGYPQAMLLDDQGRVYALGTNQYSSLGIIGTANVPRLIPFTETVPIREMTMQGGTYGASHLISRDGDLYVAGQQGTSGWGRIDIASHRLWMPWGQDKKVKMSMLSETDAHWVAGSNPYRTQGVVLENGDLYVWGDGGGQTNSGWGVGYNSDIWPGSQYHPRKVLDGVVDYGAVQGGYQKQIAVRDDGTVWGTGDSNYGVISTSRNTWAQEGVGVISNATRLTMMGSQYSATVGVLTSDGKVIMWGHDDSGGFGTGDAVSRTSNNAAPALIPERIVDFQWVGYFALSQPYFTTIFLTESGQVYASGSGYYGITGDDDSENCYSPRQILF